MSNYMIKAAQHARLIKLARAARAIRYCKAMDKLAAAEENPALAPQKEDLDEFVELQSEADSKGRDFVDFVKSPKGIGTGAGIALGGLAGYLAGRKRGRGILGAAAGGLIGGGVGYGGGALYENIAGHVKDKKKPEEESAPNTNPMVWVEDSNGMKVQMPASEWELRNQEEPGRWVLTMPPEHTK